MYHIPLAFQRIYGGINARSENRDGEEGESEDYLSSCMQMTWFYVVSRRKIKGQWLHILLRCGGEEV